MLGRLYARGLYVGDRIHAGGLYAGGLYAGGLYARGLYVGETG